MKRFILALIAILFLPAVAMSNVLTWQDNSQIEGGYAIEMLTAGSWAEVARVAANVTTYTDSNTEGVYRVRALLTVDGSDVFSVYSNTAAKLNAPVNATVK